MKYINSLLKTVDIGGLKSPLNIVFSVLFFFSLFIILSFPGDHVNYKFFIYLIFFTSWYYIFSLFEKYIKIPVEILLVLLLIFYFADMLILKSTVFMNETRITGKSIPFIFHTFLLICQIFIISLILVLKKKEYFSFLIWYVILLFIFSLFLSFEISVFIIIFQFFLFFSLLNRTAWLENKSRHELAGIFIISIIMFFLLEGQAGYDPQIHLNLKSDPRLFSLFSIINNDFKNHDDLGLFTWYSLPLFLHYIVALYFLACAVRIPLVIIYNHAGLSRKMWVSGLFQSTVPQFIQMLVFIVLFFFFISGWQSNLLATKLRLVFKEFEHINNVKIKPLISEKKMRDYEYGTVKDENNNYYIFSTVKDSVHFIKADSVLLRNLSSQFEGAVLSGLITRPYTPENWIKPLYDINLAQRNKYIKIFPFVLLTKIRTPAFYSEIYDSPYQVHTSYDVKAGTNLCLGRVFLPLVNDKQHSYYIFDIYLKSDLSLLRSSLIPIVIPLILLFILLNTLIIKRVVSFGSQINRIIIKRFQHLKNGIREISAGNLDYKLKTEGEDEFKELGNHFNLMGEKLKDSIAQIREKERLDEQLKIARNVQLSLLPEKLPDLPGFNIVAELETAHEVGGDFYDCIKLDKDKYLFTVGDVSGKGSSAALYMAQFISLLRYSVQFTKDLNKIALRLNEYFRSNVKDKQIFVTVLIGIIDTAANKIRLLRAGHLLPYVIPAVHNSVSEMQLKGIGIGLGKTDTVFKKSLQIKELELKENEMLVLLTDGFVEGAKKTRDGKTEIFGEKALKRVLKNEHGNNAIEVIRKVKKELMDFYHDQPLVDDYTIMIIQKKSGS